MTEQGYKNNSDFCKVHIMSEEFIKLATDEINQAIAEMEKTLSSCVDDEAYFLIQICFKKSLIKLRDWPR